METVIATLITSLGTIITVFIQTKNSKKMSKIDDIKREWDKTYLTDFLTEVENEVNKSEIQIKRAYEIYEEYTALNGNSYIHNKWEELVKEGKL